MVNWLAHSLIAETWLIAQNKTPLERMPPPLRAKVLAAFAGFVILGFGLIALAYVGARVTRRYMNQEPVRRRKFAELQDDWTSKPLVPPGPMSEDGNEQE